MGAALDLFSACFIETVHTLCGVRNEHILRQSIYINGFDFDYQLSSVVNMLTDAIIRHLVKYNKLESWRCQDKMFAI